MNVFRIHIRPSGGLGDPDFSFAYCLDEGVLGVGWQVPVPDGESLTWEAYLELAAKKHGMDNLSRVRYLHDNVKPGDLIWTRDTRGRYYLAMVESPHGATGQINSAWEYLDTPRGRDADIVNVVRCRIIPVPQADDIPGKVVACFRSRRTIQAITDSTTVIYSQVLWNELAGLSCLGPPSNAPADVFSFLDAETTEDIIFIYLQCQGWLIVPNSRKADTMQYEFVAIHRDTHERALVQVKTGSTPLAVDAWAGFREKIFLFQPHGIYTGAAAPNVVPISPTTIKAFMTEHLGVMPRSVQRWISYVRSVDLE